MLHQACGSLWHCACGRMRGSATRVCLHIEQPGYCARSMPTRNSAAEQWVPSRKISGFLSLFRSGLVQLYDITDMTNVTCSGHGRQKQHCGAVAWRCLFCRDRAMLPNIELLPPSCLLLIVLFLSLDALNMSTFLCYTFTNFHQCPHRRPLQNHQMKRWDRIYIHFKMYDFDLIAFPSWSPLMTCNYSQQWNCIFLSSQRISLQSSSKWWYYSFHARQWTLLCGAC